MIIFCIWLTIIVFHFIDDKRINPYNKYKIYYNRKEKYYYVKYLKSYFLPIYFGYVEYIPSGFEPKLIKFNTLEIVKTEIESEYKYYQKEKLENKKNKKQKVYEK